MNQTNGNLYICISGGNITVSKSLHMLNPCFHIVGSSIKISFYQFQNVKIDKVCDNNIGYNIEEPVIDR